MREDLNKVLCEDSRNGGLDFHWYRKQMDKLTDPYEDYEDDVHIGDSSRPRVGIRSSKLYWGGRRHFNEHLNPLRGVIRKNVGRKWDKVYSELCSVFDKRSVINQHILIHLEQFVNTKDIVIKEGKVWVQEHYRSWRYSVGGGAPEDGIVPLNKSGIEWYVDPRDGILKYNKSHDTARQRRRQREKERQKEQLDIKQVFKDGTEIFRSDNGQWYIAKYEFYNPIQDWIKERFYNYEAKQYEDREVFKWTYPQAKDYTGSVVRQQKVCILSKQMNNQELKQYDVQNRPVENGSKFSNAKLKKRAKRLTKNVL